MIEYFAQHFFGVPLQIGFNLIFVVIYLVNIKKLKSFVIIFLYGVTSLAQSLLGVYLNVFDKNNDQINEILEGSINAFLLVEFNVFGFYIFSCLMVKKRRALVAMTTICFSVSIIFLWYRNNFFTEPSAYLSVAGAFLTIINCLIFFYENLVEVRSSSFTKQPSFYVITGILFLSLFVAVLSIYLSDMYIKLPLIYNMIYSINCIAYTLLFIFFIKALKCQINIA